MTSEAALDSPLDARFIVLSTLGRAAGGVTVRVRDRRGGDPKVLTTRTATVSDPALEKARRTLAVHHSGLVPVEELGRSDHGVFWLQPDLGDVTLDSAFEAGRPLAAPLAVELLRQALEALAALHGAGGVVRNLSPADLHLVRAADQPPRLVLADLGLGHGLVPDAVPAATAVFVGRLRFASPEQFEDEGKVGPASDLYALGLIAYQALTGRFPIPGDSPSSLIAGHLFRPPTPFETSDPQGQISEPLRRWVLGLLSKTPAERGDAAACLIRLRAIAASLAAPDWAPIEALARRGEDPARLGLDLAPVEQALEDGDLLKARRLFDDVRQASGDGPAVQEMARRLAAVEKFTHAAEVHRLVSTAQRRLEAGAPAAAVGNLEEARRLVPEDPEVARLLDHARRAMRRTAPADGPTAMLHQVREVVDAEASAHAQAEEQRRSDRSSMVEGWLEEARASAQAESFDDARVALQRILALSPDDPEALALLASVEACLKIRQEEIEERGEVERTVSGIHELLREGHSEAAQESLEAAEQRFGDQDLLHTVRFDVTKARLDAEVSRTVQLSPEDLRAALAAETAPQPPQSVDSVPAHTVQLSARDLEHATAAPPPDPSTRPLSADAIDRARAIDEEELPSTVTMPGDVIEAAKQRALASQPTAPSPAATPQPSAPPGGATSLGGHGSVTLPMEAIEAAKKRALEFRAEAASAPVPAVVSVQPVAPRPPALPSGLAQPPSPDSGAPSAVPPGSISTAPPGPPEGASPQLPGHGSVTLPMESVQEARRRAGAEAVGHAPRPASTAPAARPPAPAAAAPPPVPGPTGAAQAPPPAARPAPAASPPQSPPPPKPAPAAPRTAPPARAAEPAAPEPAIPGPAASATPSLLELGFGGEEPPSSTTQVAHRTARRAAPPGHGPSRPLLAVGLLAILGAVFAASFFLSGRLETGPSPDEPPPVEDVGAVDLPPAFLTIDATPWADIASLTDGAGEEVQLVGARSTPKRVELPPGTYTVRLVHPPSGESKDATLELASEEDHELRVPFDLTLEEFFVHAGW